MTIHAEGWPFFVFIAVMLCWFAFAAAFLFRKKPPSLSERKRDRNLLVGLVLHGLAYALTWLVRRPMFSSIVPVKKPLEAGPALFTITLAGGSVSAF